MSRGLLRCKDVALVTLCLVATRPYFTQWSKAERRHVSYCESLDTSSIAASRAPVAMAV